MNLPVGQVPHEAIVHLLTCYLALILGHNIGRDLLALIVLVKRWLTLVKDQIKGFVRSLQADFVAAETVACVR